MYISDFDLVPSNKNMYPESDIGEKYIGISKITKQKYSVLRINRIFINNSQLYLNLQTQIEFLSSFFHPNIQKYIDCHYDDYFQYLILENEEKPFYALFEAEGSMTELEVFNIFKQLISAVEYLHQNNIIHLDIRPESIFFVNENELRLGNFYNAKRILPGQQIQCQYGTINFSSPESKAKKFYDGKAADIYACGMLLLSMFMRKLAISGTSPDEIKKNFIGDNIMVPIYIKGSLRKLILDMIDPDPNKRIPIEEVKNSEWFIEQSAKI